MKCHNCNKDVEKYYMYNPFESKKSVWCIECDERRRVEFRDTLKKENNLVEK
jgi:hypothetical protein